MLSAAGRANSVELGRRRRDDNLAAIFTSDLRRAVETAEIAFGDSGVPILADWRLRECDYGELNGAPVEQVHADRLAHLDVAYPGGESWRQATDRVGRWLVDLPTRWDGKRVLAIGHVATRFGLDCALRGADLGDLLVADFQWQEGWEYHLTSPGDGTLRRSER